MGSDRVFKEEAYELLAELEGALLELESSPEDSEQIGRVFRVMHTIKGSSSMFGFEEIASLTHDAETVFELVRKGGIAVSKELIDLTLKAADHIRRLLDGVSGPSLRASTDDLIASFKIMIPKGLPKGTEKGIAEVKDVKATHAVESCSYKITFKPDREIFRNGTNVLGILNDLHQLGQCNVSVLSGDLPELAEIDPESCYLAWEIELATDRGADAIRDAFIFVGNSSEVSIEPIIKNRAANERPSAEVKNGSVASLQSIRVHSQKLDTLVNLVGELVTVRARLTQAAAVSKDLGLISIAEEVERLTEELRDSTMSIRMMPIGATFTKFRRLVRDLSKELGKEVELMTEGAETELDKTVIERLNDPLVHIIRNSIDHGVEAPEARLAAGKTASGKVFLRAAHSGAHVVVEVADDGAGLDPEAIRARAVETGLLLPDAAVSEKELFGLILAPGFTTSTEVTGVSGRGVGMDVVKRAVDGLRGSIEIESRKGVGTAITLRLPLTLAIIEGLLVRIGREHFVLPLSMVEECVELTREDVRRAHGRHLANVRGEIVPYVSLRERFGINGGVPSIEQIVIMRTEAGRVGFVVDSVIGEHQTVIKSLGRFYRNVESISGATILGDGTVALILDVPKLIKDAELEEKALTN